MDTSGGNPWAWFISLESPDKFFAGIIILFVLMVLTPGLGSLYCDGEPNPFRRYLTGLILTIVLIIYFWPEIYHFFRWWLPYQGILTQAGAITLVCIGLALSGHNIECGLLSAGFSSRGQGSSRDFGFFAAIAGILIFLSYIYIVFSIIAWVISSVLALISFLT